MRYLIVGYTAKGNGKEYSGNTSFILDDYDFIPAYSKIRNSCLDWVKENIKNGEDFTLIKIDFMQFVKEADHNSFMEVTE